MASESAQYLSTLQNQIIVNFSWGELESLCVDLGLSSVKIIDPYDAKPDAVHKLIVDIVNQDRLQQLINLLRKKRSDSVWADIPENFKLPDDYKETLDPQFEHQDDEFEYYLDESSEEESYEEAQENDSIFFGDVCISPESTTDRNATAKGISLDDDIFSNTPREVTTNHETNITTDGGDYIAGNQTIQGDNIGRDKIEGDVVYGNQTVNNYFDSPSTPAKSIEETIRLDVASPAKVFLKKMFEIAVAVRQPESETLDVEGLPNVTSKKGVVFHEEDVDFIEYKIEVSGDGFTVEPEFTIFRLKPGMDSPTRFFQLTPLRKGKHILYIDAFQETAVSAAQSRIEIEVEMEVSTELEFLNFLISQLKVYFKAVPDTLKQEVETIENLIEMILDMAFEEKSNPTMLTIMCENLSQSSSSFSKNFPKIPQSVSLINQAIKATANNHI